MRVYFVGSTCVGKTTLARYVSEKCDIRLITEVARMILSEQELQLDSLRTNLDMVDSYQSDIFFRQLEEEEKYKDFVSDRSLDCLAYTAQHSRILSKIISSPEFANYLAKLAAKDTLIFFVRPCKSLLKQDGVRERLDWDAIISIDGMVKFMLEQFGLNYISINMESMQERVRFIDSVLALKNS